jgi:hypothetical protein
VYTIAEDHVDAKLLFCGTEFGVFFSQNGGETWVQLKAGLPTIAVRDIEIQRRENDLVLATFGRGFYILDDYSPLRNLQQESFDQTASLFPIKDAWMFIPNLPLGLRDKGHLGSSYYATPNPPVGAVFTYWLKEDLKTLKTKRQEAEKAKYDKKETVYYPDIESLRKEDEQPEPYLLFSITDADGDVVRHIKAPATKGLKRIVWDFRHNTTAPVQGRYRPAPDQLFGGEETGQLAIPGTYSVSLSKYEDGVLTPIAGPLKFVCKALNNVTLPATDLKAYADFCAKIARLRKALSATNNIRAELAGQMRAIQSALQEMPAAPQDLLQKAYTLERRLNALTLKLNGDFSKARREFETAPAINERLGYAMGVMWSTTSAPTQTALDNYTLAVKQFGPALGELKTIATEITDLGKQLDLKGAPATPGRWPVWE